MDPRPPASLARRLIAQTVDTALEGTVVLSFSRLGYQWRDRVFGWTDLTERPMHGKVAIVTGATSGLGLAAATRLASLGASVRIVGRDIGRTEQARARIVADTGNADVEIGVADLARLDDVRRYAQQFRSYHDRLDVLVNNAGALVRDHELTGDGIELTAQTHVVAPFLLTHELLGLLGRTAGSRVVTVSSGGMYTQRLDLGRLDRESATGAHPDFDGVAAYALAKRAQVVLNGQWAERTATSGVTFHAMHPGWVDTPGVQTSLPDFARVMGPWLRSPFQGADTMVWLATAREPLESNGRFWLDRHQRWPVKLPWTRTAPDDADQLWRWVADRARLGTCTPSPDHRPVDLFVSRAVIRTVGQPRMEATTARSGSLVLNRDTSLDREGQGMKIGIVGTGISGLVCAHLLHPHHDITVFEAADRLGGHTNTVRIDLPSSSAGSGIETHDVDTGFIVYNERNYPNFVALLDQLGVATQPGEMSFSVSDPRIGLEYRGTNLDTLYAQRGNIAKPWFTRMLLDIVRFNRSARRLLDQSSGTPDDLRLTLDDLLEHGRYSDAFVERFLVPLGASIWSADPATFTRFPAVAYARFMDNHGLLRLSGMPQWRTISGGSHRYVEALTAPFAERIRLGSPVRKIVRRHQGEDGIEVELMSPTHGLETFDRVIIASHSNQALGLLSDASPAEHEILGAIGYQPNVATLHTDERFLPANRRARASWNYHLGVPGDEPRATLTYWMNPLQSLESEHEILVTLNRHDEIDPDTVLAHFDYDHPVFDAAAMAAQTRRHEIQGVNGTFFAGAYWGYGFHEDGVRSALDVCRHFGVTL